MALKDLARLIDEAVRQKTPEQEFLHWLNEAYARLNPNTQPSRTYKPSSLGGCMRRVVYEVTGEPIDPGYSDPSIAESGTDRHARIQYVVSQMKDLGYDVEWVDVEEYLKIRPQTGTRVVEKRGYETKLYNEVLNLSFMCDGIIRFKGRYYLLEIKTEANFKWQGRVAPEEKHRYQAAAYSVCLGIDQVIFIYEGRDFCTRKAFLYEVTEQDKQEKVLGYIEACNDYIAKGLLPPKTGFKSECSYCMFTAACREGRLTLPPLEGSTT